MLQMCIFYAFTHGKGEANWKLKMTELIGDTISAAGSGMCELTNQSRLDSQEGEA